MKLSLYQASFVGCVTSIPKVLNLIPLCLLQDAGPTPRTDRIDKDYEKDHPSVEVEARKVLSKDKKKDKKNIENVKLDTEVIIQGSKIWGEGWRCSCKSARLWCVKSQVRYATESP